MNDRKTVHKWLWVWEFEKEEAWLNSMAESGWALDGVGFCTYHFVRCQPGEYTVRLQMCDFDSEYRSFLEDISAEYIGRVAKWVYYRRRSELGPFELFSDLDSKIQHLQTISNLLKVLMLCNLCIGIANSFHAYGMGALNLLCAALMAYGMGRIDGKLESLKSERMIYE